MKDEVLKQLTKFENDLRKLKKQVLACPGERVTRHGSQTLAEEIADYWVEDLRSTLEHKFKLPTAVIEDVSAQMKRLHVLSRPNNHKTSYTATIEAVLKNFKNKLVLPIQQSGKDAKTKLELLKLLPGLKAEESEYLKEAITCATEGHNRAAIVLGWCAAVDRIRKKIEAVGFPVFNATSTKLKQATTGKRKRYNKEFTVATMADLQEVFDADLIIVAEGMGLLDGNQADRLVQVDFQYRNHSAHPGDAPIEDPHVVAFFTDINSMILTNPKLSV